MDKSNNTIEEKDNLIEAFDSMLTTLSTIKAQCTAAQQQVKATLRIALKERRGAERKLKKKKQKADRAPSGFAKPSNISDALSEFMDADPSELFARTTVTQRIIKYITENKLQNPNNRKIIIPDKKLKDLLNLSDTDELTYFNLQKYMNQHFPKN